ncbi:GFA family protein [Sphingomonas sp.]|jgi:hypothetical protein|uniref:GFA family protein n=1 Tax=Sphingomonas sp. TaxID=28214 RepID=UPI002EDB2DE2
MPLRRGALYACGRPCAPVYCCHCRFCQTWSGSAFSEQAFVREDAVTAEGPLVAFEVTGPSGATSHQHACAACHTRIYNTNSARPGIAVVRAGTLDDSETLVPRAHIWLSRKQSWVALPDDVPAFAENPAPAEFIALMMRR